MTVAVAFAIEEAIKLFIHPENTPIEILQTKYIRFFIN